MITNLKWGYLVSSNYSWFDSFARNLGRADVSILIDHEDDKPDAYFWSSLHLSELDDLQEVADRAAALKSIYDGAMYLTHGIDYRPIEFLSLVNLSEDKKCNKLEGNYLTNPFASDSNSWTSSNLASYYPFGNFTSTLLYLARNDEHAKGMLQFLGVNGITWISLYALLDFMRQDWTIPQIANAAGSTKDEINRFTHTANNFAAIGPLARHGNVGYSPPSRVMTLAEASNLILKAGYEYLINKCTTMKLKENWNNGTN